MPTKDTKISKENLQRTMLREDVKTKSSIRIEYLDFSDTIDTVDQIEKLVKRLEKRDLKPKELFYSGFDFDYIKKLLKTGDYSRYGRIYCSSYQDLIDNDTDSALHYTIDYANAGLVVYDPKFLVLIGDSAQASYSIKPNTKVEDLIKIIYKIK